MRVTLTRFPCRASSCSGWPLTLKQGNLGRDDDDEQFGCDDDDDNDDDEDDYFSVKLFCNYDQVNAISLVWLISC